MSARSLRKVLEEQEQTNKVRGIEERDEDEEECIDSPESSVAPVINPFNLLNDDEFDKEEEPESNEESPIEESKAVPLPRDTKKKKKKKKTNTTFDSTMENQIQEINLSEAVASLSIEESSSNRYLEEKPTDQNNPSSILQTDPKFLDPENELKRIFGAKVVKSFERSRQATIANLPRGGRRRIRPTKKTILVSPADHWPRWDGSLSMEFLESKNKHHFFRYVHSSSYLEAQKSYEEARALHDLNGIAMILHRHPYHLDSLIAVSEYFQFAGEPQLAADAVAKGLYALECAWHPLFTPLKGNCHVETTHETNKPLFKFIFSHMRNLDRRGCHRSALEVCKLLLSLDDDDPTGAKFCIDYFALRAEENDWLERFAHVSTDNSLWLFPNFAFSLAIARMYRETYPDGSPMVSSRELMKQALMLHPYVYKRLMAKVPLKERSFTEIGSHSFFRSDKVSSPSLDHLANIYVERSYIIWRLPEIQKLLKDSADEVIGEIDRDAGTARDLACVRNEAFSSERNEYSHLMVSDFSDTVATAPPENLQEFMDHPRMREHDAGAPREVRNRNPIAVLFESMLPWVNYGPAREGVDPGNEDIQ